VQQLTGVKEQSGTSNRRSTLLNSFTTSTDKAFASRLLAI